MTEIDNKLRHLRWEKNLFVFVIVFLSMIITLFASFPILLIKWESWMVGGVFALYLLVIGMQAKMWLQVHSDYKYIYSVFKIGLSTNYLKHLHPKLTEKQILQSIYRPVLEMIVNSFFENVQGEATHPYFNLEGNTEFLQDFERKILEQKARLFIRE